MSKKKTIKEALEYAMEQLKSDKFTAFQKERMEMRLAKLQGRIGIIKVGGATETEIEEKKYRVDDAVAAVKAALDEGIVTGGGVTLVNLASTIKVKTNGAEAAGQQLLKNALEQPFRILLTNSGLNADEWLPQVRGAKPGQGIDVNNPDLIFNKTSLDNGIFE
jgi:chaperonin GroEL